MVLVGVRSKFCHGVFVGQPPSQLRRYLTVKPPICCCSKESKWKQQQRHKYQHQIIRWNFSSSTLSNQSIDVLPEVDAVGRKQHEHIDTLPKGSVPLGTTLPTQNQHACSVSLPTWDSVVGYLENDPTTISHILQSGGYPRFMYHPYVRQLMKLIVKRYSVKNDRDRHLHEEDCLVLPTIEAATRCQGFLKLQFKECTSDENKKCTRQLKGINPEADQGISVDGIVRIVSISEANVHAVFFPNIPNLVSQAKAYWQHTGEVVSSRRAQNALNVLSKADQHAATTLSPTRAKDEFMNSKLPNSSSSDAISLSQSSANEELQNRIATWTNVPQDYVFLTTSGMSAIYKTLRSTRRRYQQMKTMNHYNSNGHDYDRVGGGKSIVFGFPYLDTLKLCSRKEFCPDGVEFFGHGDSNDIDSLKQLLETNTNSECSSSFNALFTEVPSNPLLQCPDLHGLRQLADEHDFCLIVDDTIGNFVNLDLIESGLADAVCSSLTKIVSGRGDAMAGSVIANPYTPKGRWLQQDMANDTDAYGGLHILDATAMLRNSADFVERNSRVNTTAEKIADYLNDHPDVETVWYPKFVAPLYSRYMRRRDDSNLSAGYGGLISIQLQPHMCPQTFYNNLNLPKGPSLGTNFSLVCPYTLLAHYHELDFAKRYNVPPDLLRISVGLEDFEELHGKFEDAFNSRAHPYLPNNMHSTPSVA